MRAVVEQSSRHPSQSSVATRPELEFIPLLTRLQQRLQSRWPEWVTLSLYLVIVACAIPYHEPWADEAQAWQLARGLSLRDLFQTYLRYEGSPGLWHFLLWIMHRVHVSYSGMHWLSGAIAAAGISLLVFKSPFPRYLKLLFPFTYFLLFQYAVVARNYVLVPLLLFIVAWQWRKRSTLVALMLGLLANVSLHAAVISVGLAIVYIIEQVRNGEISHSNSGRQFTLDAVLLLGFYVFALWTAWPPHELVLSRVRGESRAFLLHAIVSLVWGVCQPWILSIPFWFVMTAWLQARRSVYFLLPVLSFACFSGAVYANFWHVGLVVPLILCLLWITWPVSISVVPRYETMGRAALIFMACVQILWSVYALRFDHFHAYSPDLAASKFLEPFVHDHGTIAVTYLDEPWNRAYDSTGILPYFDHNIYVNQPQPFWWWSSGNPTEDLFTRVLPSHPRIVLVEVRLAHPAESFNLKAPKIEFLNHAGYRFTNAFCGTKPERFELGETSCHLIFQYVQNAKSK